MLFFISLAVFCFVSNVASNEVELTARPLRCGLNEREVKCRQICPPQNCEISYTDYDCESFKGICERGCDCLPDHLRNGSGICIKNDDCPYPSTPVCGVNEIARDCRRTCPPQTCLSRVALIRCPENDTCEPGCDCVPNYLRNTEGVCIPAEKCNLPKACSVADNCKRTCAKPNPPCPYTPAMTNIDGCECMEGFILSEIGGKCIRIEDCPKGCSGDPHARAKRCPQPCPSTCQAPNAVLCRRMCEAIGCECEAGFLRSNITGMCIAPEKCPGGNPCRKNEEFRQCKNNCAQDYCPANDKNDIFCNSFPVCLSGCACKFNYKRVSLANDKCIVASDCPPVRCSRPNEVWNSCPEECFSGYCNDRQYENVTCNNVLLNCQPKCVCKPGTYRNESGICVPASECST